MPQQRKPIIVRVSRHRRPVDKECHYPPINTRQSNGVIHVTIGSMREVPSTNNKLYSTKGNIRISNNASRKRTSKAGRSSKLSLVTRSSKVNHHESVNNGYNPSTKNFSDRTDTLDNKLRESKHKEKNKCSLACILVFAFIILSVIVIATVIPLGLLLKSKRTTPSDTPVLRWNTTGITVAGITGTRGNASNQLYSPTDVKLDYANNFYIVDYNNHRIQKYLFGSSTGLTVAGNGTNGSTPSELYKPARVVLDANENLYIADTGNQRIQFWRKGDVSGSTVAGTGSFGSANNQLYAPYDVALDPTSGTLYIADSYNHRIMLYASGVNNGTLLLGGVGAGTNSTQLNYPISLYFDSFSNNLVIANSGANNIVRYVLGANGWTLVAGDINGTLGNTSTTFHDPYGVVFDPMGNMYVADRTNHRIQFFSNGQSNGITIAGITGSNGTNATALWSPWAVRLDSQLNLYVADTANHRIQKFLRY